MGIPYAEVEKRAKPVEIEGSRATQGRGSGSENRAEVSSRG